MLQQKIKQLQRDIFDYNIGTVPAQLSNLMTTIIETSAFDLSDIDKVQRFNHIMQACLEALQKQDYLLLADITQFELENFLDLSNREDNI
ncbi:hypothetical protein [Syntrophomonas wolfei]|jgi:hypothetical protein|uniref:hypothetical protein n=1 Tax=Syntrophomonas wolfei TaxID=863 RepID=UPI00077360F0|nr:hypothetical protein [Syntrophomonas wolfei]